MAQKLITLLVEESLLEDIDSAAKAANDGKQGNRTQYMLEAVKSRLSGSPMPEDKRLASIIESYEGCNPKGRRYIATCAELAAEHEDFKRED